MSSKQYLSPKFEYNLNGANIFHFFCHAYITTSLLKVIKFIWLEVMLHIG